MDIARAVALLNGRLRERNPSQVSRSWIKKHIPHVYRYLSAHFRTERGEIDWDAITRKIERPFLERWKGHMSLQAPAYCDRGEVDTALRACGDKRYLFLILRSRDDLLERDTLSIRLVRLAQGGNQAARQELIELLQFTIDAWVERRSWMCRWKGYTEQRQAVIDCCIRHYRFSGSFMGYLFRSLALMARSLPPVFCSSLDKNWGDTKLRKEDSVIQDPETGEIRMADFNVYHL